jgi:alpha-beta hydrolase superfamily lysophospholipase
MSERSLDGHAGRLHVQEWAPAGDPTHIVIIAHGYGEHIGRYGHVADAFTAAAAVVAGLDHAGHGRSDGPPALIADFAPVVEDLHLLVDAIRRDHTGLPVVLVGHSMGGLIATRYAQRYGDGLAGLVLSAPLIGNPGTGVMLAMEPLPEIPIDPAVLSRDEAVGRAYAGDPLVYHGGFQRPTLAAMATALLDSALEARQVRGPVLWQHGTADQLVPLEGTRRLIELLDQARVQTRHYPDARHEIYNEVNRDEVLADTTAFIDEVVGAG